MSKSKKKETKQKLLLPIVLLSILSLLLFLIIFINFYFLKHFFPNTTIAGVDLSFRNKIEAVDLLTSTIQTPKSIIFVNEEERFEIPLEEVGFSYNFEKTVLNTLNKQKLKPLFLNYSSFLVSFASSPEFPIDYSIDKERLNDYLSVISARTSIDPVYPKIKIASGEIIVTNGKDGILMDKDKAESQIKDLLSNPQRGFPVVVISFNPVKGFLNDNEIVELKSKLQKYIGKNIFLKTDEISETIPDSLIISFINYDTSLNQEAIDSFVKEKAVNINREPQNSVFNFSEGKVVEFTPSKDGLSVDENQFTKLFSSALHTLSVSEEASVEINIPLFKTSPKITNKDVNNLGINELIGKGESFFKGSIASRVHNVGLASSKINGVMLSPGEAFSFNTTLGDVSALTGYKQAYVIKDGKTVLGDGGGVCQVSTTLFRAVMNTGLPVTERAAHSYRVYYYEQGSSVGIDATVYAPTTDFKFVNDTENHILIQTIFEPKIYKLTIEIYGSSDGRVSTVSKPIVSGITAPPEDLYIDDPTLPIGNVKQIDYKAWGARAVFDYTVERGGEIIYQKKFVSNYKPWQAKFLRGVAPL